MCARKFKRMGLESFKVLEQCSEKNLGLAGVVVTHVSDDSIETTLEVLSFVNKEATKRKLGVLFLGDFWHGRGNYQVVPLHKTMEQIKTWNFPTLMLVGNHDQKDREGLTNLLVPFGKVNRKVFIIDKPTKYLDALFFPYRHDHKELEEAIKEAGPVKAIFPHLGVKGALLNQSSQAFEGVDAGVFPEAVPVYCGHYHKPHVVDGTTIMYVGSPYQVTQAEGGQQKALIILDKENYQILDKIPLDIGCRYHKIEGIPKVEDLLAKDQKDLREGDRINITLSKQEFQSQECMDALSVLREKGVDYELHCLMEETAPRIENQESKGILDILQEYASDAWDLNQQKFKDAVSEATKILNELENNSKSSVRKPVDVEFESVTMEGYGTFRDKFTYPIKGRSIVALIGDNQVDKNYSDSNGSGKSQLTWAVVWALTGQSVNCFQINSPKKDEIVNDYCKQACVSIKGTVNGVPFIIERKVFKTASASSLRFWLNGEEKTFKDQRYTQNLINQELSVDLLKSMIYHNFKSISELIAANDRDMKECISGIVGLDTWENAWADCKERVKSQEKQLAILSTQKEQIFQSLLATENQLQQKNKTVKEWEQNQEIKKRNGEEELQDIIYEINGVFHDLKQFENQLKQYLEVGCEKEKPQREIVDKKKVLESEQEAFDENQEQQINQEMEKNDKRLLEIQQEIKSCQKQSALLNNQLEELEIELEENRLLKEKAEEAFQIQNGAYQAAVERIKKFKNKNSHNFESSSDSKNSFECPTCLQEVTQDQFQHTLDHLQQQSDENLTQLNKLENNLNDEKQLFQNVFQNVKNVKKQLQQMDKQISEQIEQQFIVQDELKYLQDQKDQVEKRHQLIEQKIQQKQEILDIKYEKQLKEFNDRIANAKLKFQTVEKMCIKIEKKMKSFGEELLSFCDQNLQDAELTQAKINEIQIDSKCEEGADLLNQVIYQQTFLKQLKEEKNPHVKHLKETEKYHKEQQTRNEEIEEQLEECQYGLDILQEIKEAFGPQGIQNKIIDDTVNALNQSTQEILSVLTSSFQVKVAPINDRREGRRTYEKITKSVVYIGQDQQEFTRATPSDGEQRRMAAALTLGFVKLIRDQYNTKCNLIVLDEILANIDERGCLNTIKMIKQLDWNATVIVVTQRNSIVESSLDGGQIDTVVKTKNGSHVQFGSSPYSQHTDHNDNYSNNGVNSDMQFVTNQ